MSLIKAFKQRLCEHLFTSVLYTEYIEEEDKRIAHEYIVCDDCGKKGMRVIHFFPVKWGEK